MRDLVNRSAVRNTIFMMRQVDRLTSVVIVEGDSDSRCFEQFARPGSCRMFSPGYPGGKEHALALFNDLKLRRLNGVAALVDADCDRFWGRGRTHVDVCWTSAADREVMIVQSASFDKFLARMSFRGDNAAFRASIIEAALPLGSIRLMNRHHNWGLDFKTITFARFIDPANIAADIEACCEEVLSCNPNAPVDIADLLGAIQQVRARRAPAQDIVCGHDLAAIISLISGLNFTASLSTNDVERVLSNSYELAEFRQTSTYQELVQWEQRNVPFIINQ